MAKQGNLKHLEETKMPVPEDDSRDEQFHLDITKKNEQVCCAKPRKS